MKNRLRIEVSKKAAVALHATDNVFYRNVVLCEGVSLAPVIAISTSVDTIWFYVLACFLIILPTSVIGSFLPKKLSLQVQSAFLALIASVLFIPVYGYISTLSPDSVSAIGIFFPLIVVNPLIMFSVSGSDRKSVKIVKTLSALLGFSLAILLVTVIRVWLIEFSSGTLFTIPSAEPTNITSYPFFGYIVLGLIMAFTKKILGTVRRHIHIGNGGEK